MCTRWFLGSLSRVIELGWDDLHCRLTNEDALILEIGMISGVNGGSSIGPIGAISLTEISKSKYYIKVLQNLILTVPTENSRKNYNAIGTNFY